MVISSILTNTKITHLQEYSFIHHPIDKIQNSIPGECIRPKNVPQYNNAAQTTIHRKYVKNFI